MGQGRTFGSLPQAIELGEIPCSIGLNQFLQQSLLRFSEPRKHCLKDPLMREVAETPNQEIERTERWEFTILFHQRFDGHVDEISRIVHDQNHLTDGFQRNVTDLLDISVNLEVGANSGMIFVEGTRRNIMLYS